jgi:hypothetical protein
LCVVRSTHRLRWRYARCQVSRHATQTQLGARIERASCGPASERLAVGFGARSWTRVAATLKLGHGAPFR